LRVLSVNVSLPRDVVWRGKTIRTGIYKEPVAGRVPLRRTNLDGDRQADLRVHGGPDKAVCATRPSTTSSGRESGQSSLSARGRSART
jgi:MOSC domain-containing protein YiiM